jgi:hypothetical protein
MFGPRTTSRAGAQTLPLWFHHIAFDHEWLGPDRAITLILD